MVIRESIQMVDLKGQYNKIKNEINSAIQNCIEDAVFINGDQVTIFQDKLVNYLGVSHVITCGNGTDALQIAIMALNLQPGDEVILPAFTYVATAEVIALLHLVPVLVDVDEDTFNIKTEGIEAAITPKTKLIVPVHLFGQCADMEEIMIIAKKYNLFVIEDTAQTIGANYTFSDGKIQKAGTIGDIGCTSFFPSKNLGCYGDGGAIYTNNDNLSNRLRMIANHGQSKKYHHDIIGVNSRLDTIQAAVLNQKLNFLDKYSLARQKAADFYDSAFKNIPEIEIPKRNTNSTHVFHQYTLKIKSNKRDLLKKYLSEKGIPSMIYYPIPLHKQKAYENLVKIKGDLLVANLLCEQVLSLPMHTELDEKQLSFICNCIISFF